MINIDQSLFIQIINFLVLTFILNLILYRPVREILKKRQDLMASRQAEALGLEKEILEQKDRREAALAEARRSGLEAKGQILNQAHQEEKDVLSLATKQAEQEINRVKQEIIKDVEGAKDVLAGQKEQFAAVIAEKILGRAV